MRFAGTLLTFAVGLAMIAVYALVIRRLLGVRVGVLRTAAVTVLALVLAPKMLAAFSRGAGLAWPPPAGGPPPQAGLQLLFVALAVLAATTAALIILVLLEILVPTGSIPAPWELVRAWRSRSARTRRYGQILRIAVRHGLLRFLRGQRQTGLGTPEGRRTVARSVRAALEDGGVTFVKLGQLLSTRGDLLPPEFVAELSGLQDQATPVPWTEVAAVLEDELGTPAERVFADIDRDALAAASVGQVHAATLPGGDRVVVKVQRPGIAAVLARDLDIVRTLAATLERRTRWGRTLGLRALADGFAAALREELDFTVERDNMRSVAAALPGAEAGGDAAPVRVPEPVAALCTARVLVMQRLPGTPLGSAADLLERLGSDRRRGLATALMAVLVEPMLGSGVFHADPHPGNVLVTDSGGLGLLDLGSVGRLDGTTRSALLGLFMALDRMDSLGACDALLDLVDRPAGIDERDLERAVGQIMVRFAAPGAPAGRAAFTALLRLVTRVGLSVPPEVAAVFRALATMEGTLAALAPGFNVVDGARAIGRERLGGAFRPPRARKVVEDELATLVPVLRRLPRRVDRIADAVEHGRLRAEVSLLRDADDRRLVTDLVHRCLLAVLGATAGVMAVVLVTSDAGPRLSGSLTLYAVVGYCLFIASVVMVLRVLIVIFRRD